MRYPLICATAASLLTAAPSSAIEILPTSDAFGLANTLFLNVEGLAIQSATLSGEFGQAGTYTNASATYGLPVNGIVLSSGNVEDYADGPNNEEGRTTSFFEGEFFGEEGGEVAAQNNVVVQNVDEPPLEVGRASDAQNELLEPITGQPEHFDPVQLDIEFFAATDADVITFFSVFGSEEFPEFQNSGVNDGFGLFVNNENVAAVLPTGGQPGDPLVPVNIDNPDFIPLPGTELDGVLAPNGNPVLRFDVPIQAGELNEFSIILADAGDSVLDTTVYLSSFFSDSGNGENDGLTEFFPLLPNNPPDPETGEFIISIPEGLVEGQTIFIDPPVSVGFDYVVNNGATFSTITAPSLGAVADVDGYFIEIGGSIIPIAPAETINVDAFGASSFTLTGINPALMLDPDNPVAFPIGISLNNIGTGITEVSITPITVDVNPIPLPATAVLYIGGILAFGAFRIRARRAKA